MIVYFSSITPSKKFTLPRAYKTLEAIAVESRMGRSDIVLLAIYRTGKEEKCRLRINIFKVSVENLSKTNSRHCW